jgi:hypothetical protein
MKRATVSTLALSVFLAVFIPGSVGSTATRSGADIAVQRSGAVRLILNLERGKAPPRLPNGLFIPVPSGGMANAVVEAFGLRQALAAAAARTSARPAAPGLSLNVFGCRNVFTAPGRPANVRTNVDCGFRFQSEEWVAVNPTDPSNVVVSQNDSKLSGNRTGVDFSLDRGRHFGDSVLPSGRVDVPDVPGGQFSFDAFTDPAHAFDSRGNLYYAAVGFDAFQDPFSGVFVWKSNSCLKGSALHTPGSGSCAPFSEPLSASAVPVRTNFDNPVLSDDKELVAADYFAGSPFRDNVYLTWTIFDFSCGPSQVDYCESPIFFSRSTDGGVSWSDPLEISGSNPELCDFGDLFDPTEDPHACNFSQASHPIVGPDGTIYVAFNNKNTSLEAAVIDGVGQQLFVKSTDGGLTWTAPVKIGDDFDTQPFSIPGHELPNGCPDFRGCLPPNGYRADGDHNPSLGIDNKTGRLAAFWSDFRNGGPCRTDTSLGVPIPVEPCANHNNDVFVAISNDGGASWGPAKLVTSGGIAAQWQQWGDVGENGKLYVAYYDRKYGDCEESGCNDITLASSNNGTRWQKRRITTSSMPNLTCDNNPAQCGFLGDYMSTLFWNGTVHMVWGDTRGRGNGGVPEEDVYYARVRAR